MSDHPQSTLQFGKLLMSCLSLHGLDHHPDQFSNEVARTLSHFLAVLLVRGEYGDDVQDDGFVLEGL